MRHIWFHCTNCGHTFKAPEYHSHHCPRCNTYPTYVGKHPSRAVARQMARSQQIVIQQQQPPTPVVQPVYFVPLPPAKPNPTKVAALYVGRWYLHQSRRLQVWLGAGLAVLLLLACIVFLIIGSQAK